MSAAPYQGLMPRFASERGSLGLLTGETTDQADMAGKD